MIIWITLTSIRGQVWIIVTALGPTPADTQVYLFNRNLYPLYFRVTTRVELIIPTTPTLTPT
jgi:hypothetical protein